MIQVLSDLVDSIYRRGRFKPRAIQKGILPNTPEIQAWNLRFYLEIPIDLNGYPTRKDSCFLIPDWRQVSDSYPEACEKLLKALQEEIEGFWYHSQVLEGLEETYWKGSHLPNGGLIQISFNHDYQIQAGAGQYSYGLGLWETGVTLLSHYKSMQKILPLECPGDEVRNSGPYNVQIPVFRLNNNGQLGLTGETMRQPNEKYYSAVAVP